MRGGIAGTVPWKTWKTSCRAVCGLLQVCAIGRPGTEALTRPWRQCKTAPSERRRPNGAGHDPSAQERSVSGLRDADAGRRGGGVVPGRRGPDLPLSLWAVGVEAVLRRHAQESRLSGRRVRARVGGSLTADVLYVCPTALKAGGVLRERARAAGCLVGHRVTTFPELTDALARDLGAPAHVLEPEMAAVVLARALEAPGIPAALRIPQRGLLHELLRVIAELESAYLAPADVAALRGRRGDRGRGPALVRGARRPQRQPRRRAARRVRDRPAGARAARRLDPRRRRAEPLSRGRDGGARDPRPPRAGRAARA